MDEVDLMKVYWSRTTRQIKEYVTLKVSARQVEFLALYEAMVSVANAALGGGSPEPSELKYIDSDEAFDRVVKEYGLG